LGFDAERLKHGLRRRLLSISLDLVSEGYRHSPRELKVKALKEGSLDKDGSKKQYYNS